MEVTLGGFKLFLLCLKLSLTWPFEILAFSSFFDFFVPGNCCVFL